MEATAALTLSQDISNVPLLDGETVSTGNDLLNRFGGATNVVYNVSVSHTTDAQLVRSGNGAMRMAANVAQGGFGFAVTALGGVEPTNQYYDTRDLTAFESVRFYLRNRTGSQFTLRFEVKDYRDDNGQRASWNTTISSADQWTEVTIPLDLATPGWVIQGSPDFTRARQFALVIEANQGSAVNGDLGLDDMVLIEPGGVLDPATAPVDAILGRLAERQFRSLWGAADPSSGALETNAQSGRVMAMNTTASLVKMMPGAIERGWISRSQADAMVARMVTTMNAGLDNQVAMGGGYLPARYMDRVTFTPTNPEESVIDGAFMFLALYGYKSSAGVDPALKGAIESLLDRFNFAAFQRPGGGWDFAYNHDTHSFTGYGYDGYGGEIWTISLAAHLANVNHVDITTNYNSGTVRAISYLVDPSNAQFNHAFTQYRPPFVQWLFDLFVDTNDRGQDSYPVAGQNTNPFDNAVRYQQDVDDYFEQAGRGLFLQPDAGSSGSQYEQFSAYDNFGEPDVFMPWSVAFSFLGDPGFAEAALRNSLIHNLQGPFGLSDSAIWQTGQAEPVSYPANNDLWNTSLSTMAMMEYLYDDNQAFTDLPEVAAALDLVFPNALIDGDLNKDGYVGLDDLQIILDRWNQHVAPGNFFAGDPSGDGYVGLDDLQLILDNWNAGTLPAADAAVAQTQPAQQVQQVQIATTPTVTGSRQSRRQSHRHGRASDGIDPLVGWAMALWQTRQAQTSMRRALTFEPAVGLTVLNDSPSYSPSLGLWDPSDGLDA